MPLLDSSDRLVGTLMLGEKKSDEPYTPGDTRLLGIVARQVAVARENLRLRARVGEEVRVKHDVLARLDRTIPDLLKECPACGACYEGAVERCPADGWPLVLSMPVTRTLDGRYRLDRLLGRGGMGTVYEGWDLRLQRPVAVKLLPGQAFGQPAALRRFQREARATAHVNHPNIVALYDYGTVEGAGAYLVMERVYGTTMRAELERVGALPPAQAADWLDPLLEGLGAAHGAGIIHRDLKPENIMGWRTDSSTFKVRLLDLGLAKFHAPEAGASTSMTAEGLVMGTPSYMAPEQLSGGQVDERTDLFAVGIILIEVLTGRRPPPGLAARRVSVLARWADRLSAPASLVSRLDGVLRQCLNDAPEQRVPSAAVLRDMLIPLLRSWPQEEIPVPPPS